MNLIKTFQRCSHYRVEYFDNGFFEIIFPKRYWSWDKFLFNEKEVLIQYKIIRMNRHEVHNNSKFCLGSLIFQFETSCYSSCDHPDFIKNLYLDRYYASVH